MKYFLFLVGLLLLPVCAAVTMTLLSLLEAVNPTSTATIPPSTWALAGGFLIWLALFFFMPRPVRTYVLAHELTHALWALLSGIEVHKIQVRKENGKVVLSKTNFMVTLAPYFFPLYTILVIVAYYISAVFFEVEKFSLIWLALIGFTWSFHFTFTITTLMQHQTDIHEYGRLFSYTIIYLLNVIGIALWVVIVSDPTLEELVGLMQRSIIAVYVSISVAAEYVLDWLNDRFIAFSE